MFENYHTGHDFEIVGSKKAQIKRLLSQSIVYRQSGMNNEAITKLLEVIALDPAQTLAIDRLGRIHFCCNNFEEAAHWYKQLTALAPELSTSHFNLAEALESIPGREHEALEAYKKVLELDLGSPRTHYKMGFIYKKIGAHFQALKSFETYMEVCLLEEDAKPIRSLIEQLRMRIQSAVKNSGLKIVKKSA